MVEKMGLMYEITYLIVFSLFLELEKLAHTREMCRTCVGYKHSHTPTIPTDDKRDVLAQCSRIRRKRKQVFFPLLRIYLYCMFLFLFPCIPTVIIFHVIFMDEKNIFRKCLLNIG
jgi:hypothetical protein